MAKSFDALMQTISPERQTQIKERAQEMLLGMALQELRQTRHLTQQQLAKTLEINQAALSKMENQGDMRISTLRRILAALGGELKLVVQFPDEEVIINQFSH